MINDILHSAFTNGWGTPVYNGAVAAAFVIQMLFLIWYQKKYDISLLKSILIVCTVYPITYYWMLVLAWVENGFTNWGANNIVRVYVYVPLICLLVSKLIKVDAAMLIEYVAPSMALQQTIGHFVCPFVGCCHGYPCSWGIWNPITNDLRFPNQWLECIVAVVIFFLLYRFAKRSGFAVTGKCYPLFLVLFGSTRFLLEFLRDNEKLFRGISSLALHAAFMVLVGGFWLYHLYLKEDAARHKKSAARRAKK